MKTLLALLATGLVPVTTAPLHAAERPVVDVPATIPTGLGQDVTADLVKFFKGVPPGSAVRFPEKATYRIEGTLLLDSLKDLTIDSRGSTFRATDPLPDADKKTQYTAWKHLRTRAHWRLLNCEDITLTNLRVIGAHPNGGREGDYDYNREAQHGFDILGGQNIAVHSVHVSDVYGDGLYISKHCRRVSVRDSRFEKVGRQCIAIGSAEDVHIENCDILDSRRGLIDIEPYGTDWKCGDIRIIGNRLGGSRLLALPMGGSGSTGAVLIANNLITGPNGTPVVMHRSGNLEAVRGPFFFVGNNSKVGGSPAPAFRIGDVKGVFIAGNKLTFNPKRKMAVIQVGAAPAALFGNVFVEADRIADPEYSELLVTRQNPLATDAEPAPVEVKEIPGGYAVRSRLNDGTEAVALMRSAKGKPPLPEVRLSAFGVETDATWGWALLDKGKVIESAAADAAKVAISSAEPE